MITVVEPNYYWPETAVSMFPSLAEHVERCGRVCYKSEGRIKPGSADQLIATLCKSGHESVLEHATVTTIIICSRACSHQLVRHRIAAYSQESQRFCTYKNRLLVVCPPSIGLEPGDYESYGRLIRPSSWNLTSRQESWIHQIEAAYQEYRDECAEGIKPEDARYVLPNATKTELAVTYNLRQWRHVFKERALNHHAQWEIRGIFSSILNDMRMKLPAVFDDLENP